MCILYISLYTCTHKREIELFPCSNPSPPCHPSLHSTKTHLQKPPFKCRDCRLSSIETWRRIPDKFTKPPSIIDAQGIADRAVREECRLFDEELERKRREREREGSARKRSGRGHFRTGAISDNGGVEALSFSSVPGTPRLGYAELITPLSISQAGPSHPRPPPSKSTFKIPARKKEEYVPDYDEIVFQVPLRRSRRFAWASPPSPKPNSPELTSSPSATPTSSPASSPKRTPASSPTRAQAKNANSSSMEGARGLKVEERLKMIRESNKRFTVHGLRRGLMRLALNGSWNFGVEDEDEDEDGGGDKTPKDEKRVFDFTGGAAMKEQVSESKIPQKKEVITGSEQMARDGLGKCPGEGIAEFDFMASDPYARDDMEGTGTSTLKPASSPVQPNHTSANEEGTSKLNQNSPRDLLRNIPQRRSRSSSPVKLRLVQKKVDVEGEGKVEKAGLGLGFGLGLGGSGEICG